MLSLAQLLLTLTVAPLLAGVAIVAVGPRWPRRAPLLLAVVVVVIMAIAAILIGGSVLPVAPQLVSLISFSSVGLVHRLDDFSAALILAIAVWVTPILLWMTAPREPSLETEPASPRAMGWVLIAASLAVSAVMADNVLVIALCWGGTGLVGWLMARPESSMTPSGSDEWLDLLLFTLGPILFGLVMIIFAKINSTLSLYDMTGRNSVNFGVGILLIVVLAFGAGVYPFIIWVRRVAQGVLPESAGVLLLVQTPLALVMLGRVITLLAFKGTWPVAHIGPATFALNSVMLILGVVTILACGFVLLFERDLLAFTAILNALILGWGFVAVGTGDLHALVGLVFVLLAQTLGIGALLAVWGSFEWANRELQVQDLVGMAHDLPGHFAAMALAGLSLVGVPLFAGFAAMATIDQSVLSEGGTAALGGAIIWIGNGLALIGVGRLIVTALGSPAEDAEPRSLPASWEGIVLLIPAALLLLISIAPELLMIGSNGLLGPVVRIATAITPYSNDLSDVAVSPLGFTTGSAVWIPGAFWALAVVLGGVVAISAGIFGPETLPSPVYAGGEPYDPATEDADATIMVSLRDLATVARSVWFLPGPALWRSDLGETSSPAISEEDGDEDDEDDADEVIVIEEDEIEIFDEDEIDVDEEMESDDDAENLEDDDVLDDTEPDDIAPDDELDDTEPDDDVLDDESDDVDDESSLEVAVDEEAPDDVDDESIEAPVDEESLESDDDTSQDDMSQDDEPEANEDEPGEDDAATGAPPPPRAPSSTPRPARTFTPARNIPPGAGKGGKRGKNRR